MKELAKEFYDYTTTISITEEEWFSNLEADNPKTKEFDYNQMYEYALETLMNDLKYHNEHIERQLRTDLGNYSKESMEYKDIKKIYYKLKKNGININIDSLEKESE